MDTLLEGKKLIYQQRKNGSTYIYEVEGHYWDKKKKQARIRQTYLGRLDSKTGAFIPAKKFKENQLAAMDTAVTATAHVSGPAMLLERVDKELGL